MSWSYKTKAGYAGQIPTVQMYRRAARLSDAEYGDLLEAVAGDGIRSSRDKALTQDDYERFMRQLERCVAVALQEGRITRAELPRKIRTLDYWERKCPDVAGQSTRQRRKWAVLFAELAPFLPVDTRNIAWLARFASQACGTYIATPCKMEAWQARKVIDGLKQRILQEDPDHKFAND